MGAPYRTVTLGFVPFQYGIESGSPSALFGARRRRREPNAAG
jgi:hypothetical protein